MTEAKPTILFVCTHNAGRSALAAALARHRAGDRVTAESGGMAPADGPSMVTIASLAEMGIDDSAHQPSRITDARVRAADVVVAMKPGLDLPHFPSMRYRPGHCPTQPAGTSTASVDYGTTSTPACSC